MMPKRITGAWTEQKIVREIMVFLHSHGVGTARAVRIFKTYGADAVQVMTENPYRLARDIRGIGFKTADAIAMKLGIEKTAMIRVRAGISYALTEAMDEGHCGLPTEELTPLAVELLEVPAGLIQTALDLELADRTVIADTVGETPCIFLAGLYRAEQGIAERILRLANGKLPWPSERFGWTFAPGDKVMQIENDYDKDVYNGDIGYIDGVDPDTGELTARFDGRAITYGFGELDTLVPASTRAKAPNTRPL